MTLKQKATQIENAAQEYLSMIRKKGYDMEYKKRLAWIAAKRHGIQNKDFFKELMCHQHNYDIARFNSEKSKG